MTFLQPFLLLGLPLLGLPILIHLLNRQRYRTVPWGAMRFLLDARRLTRGMARLRFLLIMAARMLAIGGLVFAVSRPLVSGALGFAIGARPDTTILVLDRSASMEQRAGPGNGSKRATALGRVKELMNAVGSGSRLVLIENIGRQPIVLDSLDALSRLPETLSTSAASDLPTLLQVAQEYVSANQTGRTDIWLLSDCRENDWKPNDGRWESLREGFEQWPGVQLVLLSYPRLAVDDLAVRASNIRRRQRGTTAELVLDVEIRREKRADPADGEQTSTTTEVPLAFVMGDARSVYSVELTDDEHLIQGHTLPIDRSRESGWGRIELPDDWNPQNNQFYFVFADPPEHRTAIVTEDAAIAEVLRLAATAPADPELKYSATITKPGSALELDWAAASLIIWHAPLPDSAVRQQLLQYLASGRPVLFLPPEENTGESPIALTWGDWRANADPPVRIDFWRGDSDLLANSRSGAPLPVDELLCFRYRPVQGAGTVLARVGADPLLVRADDSAGPAYLLGTLPRSDHSNLAQQGITFYVVIQRLLAIGAATQGNARQWTTETARNQSADWQLLSAEPGAAIGAPAQTAGAYRSGDRLVAVNRPAEEDLAPVLDEATIRSLLAGLNVQVLEDRLDASEALASEIWRAFLIAMVAALLLEAFLCLPDRARVPTSSTD